MSCPEHARCTPDCARQGATSPAREGRKIVGIESAHRGCVPSHRVPCKQGGLARKASGVVRARTRAGRSVAWRRNKGCARRRLLWTLAEVSATKRGFTLAPLRARKVVVLAGPVEDEHARVLAFLADGESWSSSALGLALGTSQRTVQRTLDSLEIAGKVQSFNHGRARRWIASPLPGFTTTLLLPPVSVD